MQCAPHPLPPSVISTGIPSLRSIAALHRWALLVTACVVFLRIAQAQPEDPIVQARQQQRTALILFTGSDWCTNCRAFERHVLSDTGLSALMHEQFVHHVADRPVRKVLSADTEAMNAMLVERYNGENTFPLLVVVAPDGRVLDRIGYERNAAVTTYTERLARWVVPQP